MTKNEYIKYFTKDNYKYLIIYLKNNLSIECKSLVVGIFRDIMCSDDITVRFYDNFLFISKKSIIIYYNNLYNDIEKLKRVEAIKEILE